MQSKVIYLALLSCTLLIFCNNTGNSKSSNQRIENSDSSLNTHLTTNGKGTFLKLKKFNPNVIISDTTIDSAVVLIRITVNRNLEIRMNEILRVVEWKNKKQELVYIVGNNKSHILKYERAVKDFIKTLEVDSLKIQDEKLESGIFWGNLNIYSNSNLDESFPR